MKEVILLPATSRIERVRENVVAAADPSLSDEAVRQLEAFFS